jgi:hypothetical protein
MFWEGLEGLHNHTILVWFSKVCKNVKWVSKDTRM